MPVEREREASRVSRIKFLPTGLPLAFATLLTGLLATVLIWG